MNLYQITTTHLTLLDTIIEAGGELTPETEAALQLSEMSIQQKGINYARFIRHLEAEAEEIKCREKELSEMRKVRENTADRLRNALSEAMQVMNIEEIKEGTHKINFRKSKSVEVFDESLIPNEFKKFVPSISKTDIKKAIDSGQDVPGATIKENKSIQIK